jgi:hypothetical protein
MFTLMLPLIVSYDPGENIPDPVTAIGDAVSSASDNITSDLRAGRHLGFDTYAYPGDEAMKGRGRAVRMGRLLSAVCTLPQGGIVGG